MAGHPVAAAACCSNEQLELALHGTNIARYHLKAPTQLRSPWKHLDVLGTPGAWYKAVLGQDLVWCIHSIALCCLHILKLPRPSLILILTLSVSSACQYAKVLESAFLESIDAPSLLATMTSSAISEAHM